MIAAQVVGFVKQENVWRIDLGRHLALPGSEGLSAFARGSNGME